MENTAKQFYLFKPKYFTQEIYTSLKSFEIDWYKKHSSTDSLKLFHYTKFDGLYGILKTRSFRFSHVSFLNDPSELQYGIDLINSKLNNVLKNESNDLIIKMLKKLIMHFAMLYQYDIYVACFCESDNLLSQWRGFSDESGGYNLGIYLDDNVKFCHRINKLSGDNFVILRKIIYEKEIQNEIIDNCIYKIIEGAKNAINNWNENKKSIPTDWEIQAAMQSANILFDITFCLKKEFFKEENEWRLIKVFIQNINPDILTDILDFREHKEVIIPYIHTYIFSEINNSFEFPIISLRSGPRQDDKRIKKSLKLLLNKNASIENKIKIKSEKVDINHAGYSLRR